MSDQPWMKFYPSDWRGDPALRICSLAARGLWIEMLGLMHEAKPRGHLLIKATAPTDTQLAVLVGTSPDQIPDLIGELESAAVFSRTQKGVIFSRRMTKDEKKSRTARQNGKNGGNPSLIKQIENSASDNQEDKGGDKTQKPEARSQKPDKPPKSPYAWTGSIIKLNASDYAEWRRRFWAIPDFDAELANLDAYYTKNGGNDWFQRTANSLAKKHQRFVAERETPKFVGGV